MINVVLLKRDLRLRDHEPLVHAAQTGLPTLLLFCFEPSLINDPHYSDRHWRFIWQSLQDLNAQLKPYQTRVLIRYGEVIDVCRQIQQSYRIAHLFSHLEVGIDTTFARDKALKCYVQQANINWHESAYGNVQRNLSDRRDWQTNWQQVYQQATMDVDLAAINFLHDVPRDDVFPAKWSDSEPQMQVGGERKGWFTLNHFLQQRGIHYAQHISSPALSRLACSRLSPYLAWGNLSVRQVYQKISQHNEPHWQRALSALGSRLHWHDHFIQKFESECQMQHRPTNQAYARFPYEDDEQIIAVRVNAWQTGMTGVPMVDAAMRALCATGYINFRMRAMLVSFLCHHLNIHWQYASEFLARQFLDFEPGIHYPQIHMQAGVTGTNTIRIYNPVLQAKEKDPEGQFIYQWCPELKTVPLVYLAEPWKIPPLEKMWIDMTGYPDPIVDVELAAKAARERLWTYRKLPVVKREARRILARHVQQS